MTDQALADPKVGPYHLTKQGFNIVDRDKPRSSGCHDDSDASGDRDAALTCDQASVILVQQEMRTELTSESNRLRLAGIESDDVLELRHIVTVARSTHGEPCRLSEIDSPRSPGGHVGVDDWRYDDGGVER